MKKILSSIMAMTMVLALAACGNQPAPSEAPGSEPASEPAGDGKYEIAMITDIGTIDDRSFNQGTWEGVVKYAEEHNITHQYYKPLEQSNDAYLSAIELAIEGGAKIIVTPGFLFEVPIYTAQDEHPDVHFVLIDGYPNDGDMEKPTFKTADNAVGIKYSEEQAGYLAGYAAVKEGYTKLGFMGGLAVPAVVRYGYGFVQGAEAAAKELGMADGSIEMNYHYTGGFAATPEAQALAASWYQAGTEVIFGCGGAVGNSVMAAAEASEGKKVIGVDVDQSFDSETVITSAMKGLGQSVYDTLDAYYNDKFPAGESKVLGADVKGVQLAMENARFEKFTQADYDAVYEKIATDADGIASGILKDDAAASVAELPVKAVVVTEIK